MLIKLLKSINIDPNQEKGDPDPTQMLYNFDKSIRIKAYISLDKKITYPTSGKMGSRSRALN